jgi:hypothetical protein
MVAAGPGHGAGAWSRGKGNVFASVSWSNWADLVGLVQDAQEPITEPLTFEMTTEISTYFEYGVTDRLTIGYDGTSRPEVDTGSRLVFAKLGLGNPDWYNQYALELAVGPEKSVDEPVEAAYRVTFSYGRGYELFERPGWVNIDAKAGTIAEEGLMLYQIDSTLGIRTSERDMWYLQMQSGMVEGGEIYTQAVPTYVRSFGNGLSIETALRIGIENDTTQGIKLGAWLEY